MIAKLFHVPHSSLNIPDEFASDFLISKEELYKEAKILCDNDVDKLLPDNSNSVIFNLSRVICDVERYLDHREIMNEIGMGAFYEVGHDLKYIRKSVSIKLLEYYKNHHKLLNKKTKKLLKENNEVCIIDLHSYSKNPHPYELFKTDKRPEICIGLNDVYNGYLLEDIINIIKHFGFSYSINQPFKGSLIPSEHINEKNLHSFMIEIRKDIYSGKRLSHVKDFIYKVYKI